MIRKLTLIGITLLLFGCFGTETKNAEKAYKYWSKSNPPEAITLIKGEYYQSPHFTLEYEFFLKFKSDSIWFAEFIERNHLKIDTIGNDWESWTEFPNWFNPNQNYLKYAVDPTDQFERSRYMRNPDTGINYIYETIGM